MDKIFEEQINPITHGGATMYSVGGLDGVLCKGSLS